MLLGVNALALSTRAFFALNVPLVLIWLAVAIVVVREHRRLSTGEEADESA